MQFLYRRVVIGGSGPSTKARCQGKTIRFNQMDNRTQIDQRNGGRINFNDRRGKRNYKKSTKVRLLATSVVRISIY